MTETTIEKTVRNKSGSTILIIFAALLVFIIGYDFYKIFHVDSTKSMFVKVLDFLQLIAAFVGLLWLALILIVSSMTLSGPAFKKTSPYTTSFLFVLLTEIINHFVNDSGYVRWFWGSLGLVLLVLVLLQMLAFSLDPHSTSIFSAFRPFRIETLTVIQLSSQSPSIRKSERSSIV